MQISQVSRPKPDVQIVVNATDASRLAYLLDTRPGMAGDTTGHEHLTDEIVGALREWGY